MPECPEIGCMIEGKKMSFTVYYSTVFTFPKKSNQSSNYRKLIYNRKPPQ